MSQTTEEKLQAMLGEYYRMESPGSPNAAILQNILGAENVLRDPQSENEALLKLIYEDGVGNIMEAAETAKEDANRAEAAAQQAAGIAQMVYMGTDGKFYVNEEE